MSKKERYFNEDEDKKSKIPGAVDWLEKHPEDIPLARENLEARKHYDDGALRNLFAAVSLRACVDYEKACRGVKVAGYEPSIVKEDCHNFFESEMFQMFINRIPTEEVERMIRSTPSGALSSLVKQIK